MTPRAYTVREIDDLRSAVRHAMDNRPSGEGIRSGGGFSATEAEEHVRTYMLAGLSAHDVDIEWERKCEEARMRAQAKERKPGSIWPLW